MCVLEGYPAETLAKQTTILVHQTAQAVQLSYSRQTTALPHTPGRTEQIVSKSTQLILQARRQTPPDHPAQSHTFVGSVTSVAV